MSGVLQVAYVWLSWSPCVHTRGMLAYQCYTCSPRKTNLRLLATDAPYAQTTSSGATTHTQYWPSPSASSRTFWQIPHPPLVRGRNCPFFSTYILQRLIHLCDLGIQLIVYFTVQPFSCLPFAPSPFADTCRNHARHKTNV